MTKMMTWHFAEDSFLCSQKDSDGNISLVVGGQKVVFHKSEIGNLIDALKRAQSHYQFREFHYQFRELAEIEVEALNRWSQERTPTDV
jgi:hypothetical protein